VRLLNEQAKRCRAILAKLTELSSGAPFDRMKLSTLIEEVVAPHRNFGVADQCGSLGGRGGRTGRGAATPRSSTASETCSRTPSISPHERVEVAASWNGQDVAVTITDDGPGFAPEVMDRIGEPYVTNRRRHGGESEASGLGLGFLHRQDLAGALGRHARLREPRVSGPGGDRPRALGPARVRTRDRLRGVNLLLGGVNVLAVNPLPGVAFRSSTGPGRRFIIDYSLEVIGHLPRLGRQMSGANRRRARWIGGAQPRVEA